MNPLGVEHRLRPEDLPPGGALIAGAWRKQPLTMPVRDPENGELVGFVHPCSSADVDEAVSAGLAVLEEDWPLHLRAAALRQAASAVLDQRERFARVIAAEGVKTLREALGEVQRCAETLNTAADSTDVLVGETLPLAASERGSGRIGWFSREPLGVVAAISSFNDPLNLVAHKVAPALLAGAPIVLKPSDQTPFSALNLAEALLDAGVPAGWISVLCGGGDMGAALVAHPDVSVVSFTGGTRTADSIARTAGVKKLLMELGGNNATIVCADADLDLAVEGIVSGAFGTAGQNCLSVQRVYVEREVFDEVLDRVAAGAAALVVGSKQDPATDVGPLVSVSAAQRLADLVESTVSEGAHLVTGGRREGSFYQPTVLTGVAPQAAILAEELFGPVVMIEPVKDVEEAIERANDCSFALQAGVFTRSLDTATRVSRRLVVGAVLVNDTSDFRLDAMPFGGFKRSGIGREGIRSAVLDLTAPKCVLIRT
ncbi:MAG: aldehyde dehydrogenase family protein [Nocardioidaceae bacterium]